MHTLGQLRCLFPGDVAGIEAEFGQGGRAPGEDTEDIERWASSLPLGLSDVVQCLIFG